MSVRFSVINDNVSHCAQHSHPCWELVYRLCGSSDTVIGERTHRITERDAYLVPPNVLHQDVAQDLFSDLVIHLDDLAFSDSLILHDYDGCVYSIAQTINRIINKKEQNYQAVADSLADALIQYIRPFSLSASPSHFVRKLKEVIFENVENAGFDLTQEIKNMNYHPDYIRRCFKEETQKTPLSYLTDLRIDRARQLLVMPTRESVETIAAKCGFGDSFYFSTCFKKHTGLSPLQYRRLNAPRN